MKVSITSCENYDAAVCARALETVFEPLGGLSWVKSGMKIAIKANLVAAMKPETAATTHPALLAALTQLLTARGAEVTVGDSPGNLFNVAVLDRVYAVTGLSAVKAAGGRLNHNFLKKEAIFPEAFVARHFTYTAWLDDADVILSFAKLKSHGMMCLSAATKNLFGAVPGTMKPEYHFRFPEPSDFAAMLLDLNRYFRPRFYLVDAVETMEGNGPTAGTPRHMGALLAGTDCSEVDLVCAGLIGAEPMSVPTLRAAVERGLLPDASMPELAGDMTPFILSDFRRIERPAGLHFERLLPGSFGKMLSGVAEKALRCKPRLKRDLCIGCGLCGRICPAKAIAMVDGRPKINTTSCIRCFCCQEFCPKGAMRVHRPLPARLLTHNSN